MSTLPFPDSVLLVFCKAPIPGQVKTRLMPALSAEQAADAHRQLTEMTLRRAFQLPLCAVELCCAPDANHPFFRQCASDYSLTLTVQRGNNLGERMHNAFSDALSRYRHALLIGCDCPSLTAEDLRQALQALIDGYDAVIAPAEDGGYVLIGLSRPQPILFNDVPWGSERVMVDTYCRAEEGGLSLYVLPQQWDVDSISDWQRYQNVLRG